MTDDESRAWHERAQSGDLTVSGALWALLHAPLHGELTRDSRFHGLDPAAVSDIVTDVILAFAEQPRTFDSDKLSLDRFLRMAAVGDLLNLIAKSRRGPRTDSMDVVAVEVEDGNTQQDTERADERLEAWLRQGKGEKTLLERLRDMLPDPRDREVLRMMGDGVRRTEEFAHVLGCDNCSIAEQRTRVKQAKDRIRITLRRKGIRFDDRT